jgi:hypothetical protein
LPHSSGGGTVDEVVDVDDELEEVDDELDEVLEVEVVVLVVDGTVEDVVVVDGATVVEVVVGGTVVDVVVEGTLVLVVVGGTLVLVVDVGTVEDVVVGGTDVEVVVGGTVVDVVVAATLVLVVDDGAVVVVVPSAAWASDPSDASHKSAETSAIILSGHDGQATQTTSSNTASTRTFPHQRCGRPALRTPDGCASTAPSPPP